MLRPGIVHRLDKDTSGLMVVAKNDKAHAFLSGQFKAGKVKKQYVALVHGRIKGDAQEINLPISRHPIKRKEMAVALFGGKQALTRWKKIEEFQSGFSLLSISIKTGRTHQIRVHLSHIGHPVVGDPVYGYGRRWWNNHPLHKKGLLPSIKRQMLHATRLGFVHPEQERYLEFESPLPNDMAHAVLVLNWLDLQTKKTNNLTYKN
jgi:23S rRNA pseudouridine1911/1915/1917 synthase